MQSLRIKKFFLDYLIGSGLMVLLFLLLIGGVTVMDDRVTVSLNQECSLPFPKEDVLQGIQASLRDGERCEVVSPCVEIQVIQCEGTESISDLFRGALTGDTLVGRATAVPVKSYGLRGYKDTSEFRFNRAFVLILLAYGAVLAEAGTLVFALWRQRKLKQTFSLPPGSKKDQLLKPVLFAILLALFIVLMNSFSFALFEHPEIEGRKLLYNLLESAAGIVAIVILAPLAEELTFRGVLLRFFVERRKVLLGTVLVSLLFSVLHGFLEPSLGWQFYMSSIYFMLSVFLCRVYITQKNIWSPIVFHSAFNGTMVVLYTVFS